MLSVSILAVLVLSFASLGCGASSSPVEAPGETPPSAEPETSPSSAPTGDAPERPDLTAEACEAGGGTVVGDIGDGAIHRPDYRCPSGQKPSASIRAPEGGPVAVEGSVCCPK